MTSSTDFFEDRPAVFRLTPAVDVLLDHEALDALREAVGLRVFEELFEDAVFDVTEKLAQIDTFVDGGDLTAAGRTSHDLIAVAGQVGLAGVSAIAANLERCCCAPDLVAAKAVAGRLLRVGEESLVRAAELSVELGVGADGR